MSDRITTIRTLPGRGVLLDKRLLGVPLLVIAAVGIGYESATGQWLPVLALLSASVALTIGLHNWRWSIYGLLLYLPVSGVPIILAFPKSNLAILMKDVLFVIPAYAGFALAARRGGWRVPGAPIFAISSLAVIVGVESFNPSLPNFLVALIGMKVWLFYVPLLFLGYHFVRSRHDIRSVLGVMTAVAMVPAAVGITEAIAVYGGHADQVYSFYGSAAASVTQQFGQQDYLGGGFSRRIPSTFSFGAQYFGFLASMVAVAFAWWRLSERRVLGAAACIVLLVACFTSGIRAAFIMIPLLIVLIVLLDRRLGQGGMVAVSLAGALLAAAALFGADATVVVGTAFNIGVSETQSHFIPEMTGALQRAATGLGTGYATLSTRYALSGQIDPRPVVESWWANVVLELGVAGLAIVIAAFGQLIARAYLTHHRLVDRGTKAFSAAMIAFLAWNMVYMTKGGFIDIDPINVYFWLFAGMLLRLQFLHHELSTPSRRAEDPRGSQTGTDVHATSFRSRQNFQEESATGR